MQELDQIIGKRFFTQLQLVRSSKQKNKSYLFPIPCFSHLWKSSYAADIFPTEIFVFILICSS